MPHTNLTPSPWVQRWSLRLKPGASVLDVACGTGRHMQWFVQHGHSCTGIDRSEQALALAQASGRVVLADIEAGPWPLAGQQFDAIVVTNYLWRPLVPDILAALAPGGLLIYETFAAGHEAVGRPSRPEFFLQRGELLRLFASLRTLAYEDDFFEQPPRFVQRIAALQTP